MKLTPAQKYQRSVKRKPAKSESSLQRHLVKALRGIYAGVQQDKYGDRFFAIPNGWSVAGADARSRAIQGHRLKMEGLRAGAPDLIFYGPEGRTLWLEMKNGTSGHVSDAQSVIHRSLLENGHLLVVARDLNTAAKAVIEFYRKGQTSSSG